MSAPTPDLFKQAMRQLAATVTLVTTFEEGARHGMPATAVSSLSADPASVLVCVNRTASMHGPTLRSRFFCLNLLAADQAALCREFGGRSGGERFSVGDWREGLHGLPYVAGAAATLFCAVDAMFDYGTHTIFIGRIDAIHVDPAIEPLVFKGGAMGTFVSGELNS